MKPIQTTNRVKVIGPKPLTTAKQTLRLLRKVPTVPIPAELIASKKRAEELSQKKLRTPEETKEMIDTAAQLFPLVRDFILSKADEEIARLKSQK